jgi:hypothetical protein
MRAVVVVMIMMMMPADYNSLLVHQSSLSVLPAETSGASRSNGRKSENFAYQYLKFLKGSLTCRNILRHGTSGFTSHPKGVLRIFITFKNPSPLPGLNSDGLQSLLFSNCLHKPVTTLRLVYKVLTGLLLKIRTKVYFKYL